MHYLIIVFAIVFFAIYPSALLRFATGQIDVLSYLMIFSVIAAISQIVFARFSPLLQDSEIASPRTVVCGETLLLGGVNAVFNTLAYGAFYMAISLGDPVRATVFLELWASVFLIFTMWFRRGEHGEFQHYQGLTTTLGFFALGVSGVVLVSSAEIAATATLTAQTAEQTNRNLALIVGAAAPLLMATSFMFGTRNARTISARFLSNFGLPLKPCGSESPDIDLLRARIDFLAGIYHGLFLRMFASFLMFGVLVVAWAVFGWRPKLASTDLVFFAGVTLCAVISSAGSTLANIANNLSKTSNINMLWAFSPFLGVLLLRSFGYAETTPTEVYFGAILILAANFMLTTKTQHSIAFRFAILSLCGLAFAILFLPPLRDESSAQYVALPLGVFGILAAFFIDRIARADHETDGSSKSDSMFGQNVFTLWILGFGSVLTMVLFREADVMASDLTIVILGVAVVYMCVLPIERLVRPIEQPRNENVLAQQLLTVGLSALFLLTLFVLLILALIEASAAV
jgi:hypothetical protein